MALLIKQIDQEVEHNMPVKTSDCILIMIVLFALNIFTANLIAWRDREIGKRVLPDKLKNRYLQDRVFSGSIW